MLRYLSPSRLFPIATILMLTGTLFMIADHVATPMQEDDPGWNCYAHGNRICEAPGTEPEAWDAWDHQGHVLSLDPQRPSKVEYIGNAIIKPTLRSGDMAVFSDGKWYVFHAEYLD